MSTLLGSTGHSQDHAYWYGGNIYNQFAGRLTLPAGGPWLVKRLGVWAAGKDSSPSAKLVLWANGSSVLGQSASFTLTSRSFGLGNSDQYEKDLTSPVEVAGGTTVMVGVAFNDTGSGQFDTDTAGGSTYLDQADSWPASMAGFDSIGDEINVWLYYDPATPEVYVRRSGAWVKATNVNARRSGAWVNVDQEVYVRRSGVWVKAT